MRSFSQAVIGVCFAISVLQVPISAQLSDIEKNALAEFTTFIKSKDATTRIDQVNHLGSIDGVESTKLLLTFGLTDVDPRVKSRTVLSLAKRESPEGIALIREGVTANEADVREGCIRALAKMVSGEDFTDLIAAALTKEAKPVVQAAGLEALAKWKTPKGADRAVELLRSPDMTVILAAIRMLGRTGDKSRSAALVAMLEHKEWGVQSTALEALGILRTKESIPAILALFTKIRGRLRQDCRDCLMAITGNQFGHNPEQWQEWRDRIGEKWEVPETVKLPDHGKEGYAPPDSTGYHQIKTQSKRLVFVIDVSSSMGEKIRYKDERGNFHTDVRMTLAKKELTKTVQALDGYTEFNILAFEAVLEPFKPQLVKATAGSIDEAVRWIDRLKPYTVDVSAEYTDDGFQRGQTNTVAALKWIFGRTSKGLTFTGKLKPASDTVFFLTDGEPTCGEATVIDEVLDVVRVHHGAAPVTIHTICYDLVGVGRQMMAEIARITGGKAVVLGTDK